MKIETIVWGSDGLEGLATETPRTFDCSEITIPMGEGIVSQTVILHPGTRFDLEVPVECMTGKLPHVGQIITVEGFDCLLKSISERYMKDFGNGPVECVCFECESYASNFPPHNPVRN